MAETRVGKSEHGAIAVDAVEDDRMFDVVVTVCGHARETCPYVPATKRDHGFDDPLAAPGTEEARLHVFRYVHDEIAERTVRTFGIT